jgi:hypothetical protein
MIETIIAGLVIISVICAIASIVFAVLAILGMR